MKKYLSLAASAFCLFAAACALFKAPIPVPASSASPASRPSPAPSASPGGIRPVAKSEHWVNGYYVGYNASRMPPAEIYWEGLTHISVGAVTAVDADENDSIPPALDKTFYMGDEVQGAEFASTVSSLAKARGVIPILMLGGMGNGTAIRHATAPATFDAFVNSLIAAAKDLGFQGIDLDWEDDQDWDRFFALVKALRARAPEFVLTMPVGNLNPNYADDSVAHIAEFAPYLDQINAMSYYGCGTVWYGAGWYSGHGAALMDDGHNPVSIDYTLKTYAAAGIERKKLGMGMGFYGFGYADGITGPGQTGSGSGGVVEGVFRGGDNSYMLSSLYASDAYLYALSNGCVKWDDAARCSYLSLPADHADLFGCRYVSFEDERSILAKGQYCRDEGFGGTIVWTIDQGYVKEHSDPYFLMKALRRAFFDPGFAAQAAVTVLPKAKYAKPGKTTQFRALITGTSDLSAVWSANGGSVDATGLFSAGSAEGAFSVSASSNGLSSRAAVTVSSASWAPTLTFTYRDLFWKELRTSGSEVAAVKMIYDGTAYVFDRAWYDDRIFTNMDEVPEGGMIVLTAETSDGRSAESAPFAYRCNHADPSWEEMAVLLGDE